MTFNELHKNWQSQPKKFTLTIDSDLLLKEVERNRKDFVSSIFWRDFMEVGVSIIMFFFFIYIGLTEKIWPMFLLALSCLWLASFMITDRLMQKTREPKFAKILTDCIQTSLYQVNHQIWLLKNVIWWYLLPPGVGIAVFMIYMVFEVSKVGVSRSIGWISFLLGYLIFCFFLDWGIYLLNQRAVRKELFPRKEELEEILKSLKSNDA
ncbi:MAG TPA: hypothetical protein PLP05_06490 [Sedimentisphaerales bacterium]|nr:hypothetical protein [Sedimentisphaerales bacterium]